MCNGVRRCSFIKIRIGFKSYNKADNYIYNTYYYMCELHTIG